MEIQVLGRPVELEKLPIRQATYLERRKMYGSLATLYEMKIPLLYSTRSGNFYPFDYQTEIIDLDLPDEWGLIILQSNVILPSIFRKMKKRKASKKWQ